MVKENKILKEIKKGNKNAKWVGGENPKTGVCLAVLVKAYAYEAHIFTNRWV